jgi:very-short-patch-repair endonuclease
MREGAKKDLARSLRKNMTNAERSIWRHLRMQQLGVRFRRQHAVGPYVADFICLERRLIVEIDGGQHNGCRADEQREAWLLARGFRVKRYWNDEALLRPSDVIADICAALDEKRPHPSLPPQAGEGARATAK